MRTFTVIGMAAGLLVAGLPALADPLARAHTSYYYIDGASATVLAAQIDRNGPAGPDGQRFAGKTKWDVQWKFRHEQQGETCSMKDVAVIVGIAQTLPKWRGEANGAEALQTRWRTFSAALKRHEDGHKDLALRAGREIEAALLATKPASNCVDLAKAADSAAGDISAKYRKLDEDYDRKTDHGRGQGASLL